MDVAFLEALQLGHCDFVVLQEKSNRCLSSSGELLAREVRRLPPTAQHHKRAAD
jgi:hypothetical protein